MNIYVLDTNFETIGVIDTYYSFIWTDRYFSPGDFEIYMAPDSEILSIAKKGNYIFNNESDRLMIIETLEIESDFEKGVSLKISGRSLESILDRRIIWQQLTYTGNFQDFISTILSDSIINPEITERKIDNFIFEASTDTIITSLEVDVQYTGDNILEIIQTLCETYQIGFRILLNSENQFVFSLFAGVDRTYDQENVPYVIFSTKFDNLKNSNYLESSNTLKNVTLVAGEGEGLDRKTVTVGEVSGLDRRELYTDARDIQSTSYDDQGNEITLTTSQYEELLKERGKEKLAENIETVSFEGEIFDYVFKYKTDFYIGDIVQVENEFGITRSATIVEFVISNSNEGLKMYPTFQINDFEEEEEGEET